MAVFAPELTVDLAGLTIPEPSPTSSEPIETRRPLSPPAARLQAWTCLVWLAGAVGPVNFAIWAKAATAGWVRCGVGQATQDQASIGIVVPPDAPIFVQITGGAASGKIYGAYRAPADGDNATGAVPLAGDASAANQMTQIGQLADITSAFAPLALEDTLVEVRDAIQGGLTIGSIPLPPGASTAARQDTGNAALTTIEARTPALGQALASASSPSVLPAAQEAALAPRTTAAAPEASRLSDGAAFYKAVVAGDNLGADLRVAGADVSPTNPIPTAEALGVSSDVYSIYTNAGLNASAQAKASAGNVFSFTCRNANALGTRYIQIWDGDPSSGGTLKFGAPVPSGGGFTEIGLTILGPRGIYCATSIWFAFSTSQGSFSAGLAGDQFTRVMYV